MKPATQAFTFPRRDLLKAGGTLLKGSNLRSPLDVSFSFASEQTIDELAFLAGMDPCEFRRRNIRDERWLGVLNAVAQAAG